MYLILSDKIIVIKGNKQIAELAPGQFLVEMSLIEFKPRSTSVKALKKLSFLKSNRRRSIFF